MRRAARRRGLADPKLPFATRCGFRSEAAVVALGAVLLPAAYSQNSESPSAPPQAVKPRDFAPGVRIDWRQSTVELEARVNLREGPLELFACSPRTREHESILVTTARPLHVFQALGLIGLEPGTPVRYDEATEQNLPPKGEFIDVEIRYRADGQEKSDKPEAWLLDVKKKSPPDSLRFLFTGSRTLDNGRFTADIDGTVLCLVDFDSALISVAELHSADNELLWLSANPAEIPPLGTPVTLLIRSADRRILFISVLADGALEKDGRRVSAREIAGLTDSPDSRRRIVFRLHPAEGVAPEKMDAAAAALVAAGIARESIEIAPSSTESKVTKTKE